MPYKLPWHKRWDAELSSALSSARTCACASADACPACGQCMEQHCRCGANAGAVCLESRACDCRLLDPRERCRQCGGCRRPRGDANGDGHGQGHCRCDTHRPEGGDRQRCACAPARVDPEQQRWKARVQRGAGIPTVECAFQRFVGRDDARGDDELDTRPVGTRDMLHRKLTVTFWKRELPRPQPPLLDAQTCTTSLAAVDPLQKPNKGYMPQINRQLLGVDRILENAVYERDHEAALPSEDLVDFLLYAASIKSSRIPELIGTLDDTAAVALGIIVEEYLAQIVRDRMHPLSMTHATAASIRMEADQLLWGFNWRLFLSSTGATSLGSMDSDRLDQLKADLAEQIERELSPSSNLVDAKREIEAVVAEHVDAILAIDDKDSSEPPDREVIRQLAAKHKARVQIRTHPSKLTGSPLYECDVSGSVISKYDIQVAVDGLATREQAAQSAQRLLSEMSRQNDRLYRPPSPPVQANPVIEELYAQLQKQVQDARAAQAAARSAMDSSADATENASSTPAPNNRRSARKKKRKRKAVSKQRQSQSKRRQSESKRRQSESK